jgi:hypothetical protein
MSQAGSLSQAMDITADAAAIDAKTPAASPVGNKRNVSQHAAEKQRAGIPPPSFFASSNNLFPERRVVRNCGIPKVHGKAPDDLERG